MLSKESHILIVGLGLIGGSYALGLHRAGYQVSAIDINPDSLDYATQKGFIDNANLSEKYLINRADVIVLGLYPKKILSWIKSSQDFIHSGAILTDVNGIKAGIIDDILSIIRKDIEYISMHPMAGREVSGVKNATPDLFLNANLIITPNVTNKEETIDTIRQIGKILRFRNIEILDPIAHDKMVSFLSQLPHAIAVSLMNCRDNSHLSLYSGDSFRDLTRIANINEDLWSELFLLNKDNLVADIDAFSQVLEDIKRKVQNDDEEGLKKLFVESTKRRKSFDK